MKNTNQFFTSNTLSSGADQTIVTASTTSFQISGLKANDVEAKSHDVVKTRIHSCWKTIKRVKKRAKGIRLSPRTPTKSKALTDTLTLGKVLVKVYDATVCAICNEGHKVPERKKLRSMTMTYIKVNIKLV